MVLKNTKHSYLTKSFISILIVNKLYLNQKHLIGINETNSNDIDIVPTNLISNFAKKFLAFYQYKNSIFTSQGHMILLLFKYHY